MGEPVTPETQVSHTDEHGRTLSGMGADVEKLAETMERHAPPAPASPAAAHVPAASTGTPAAPAAPDPPVSRGRQRFSDLTRERDEAKAAAEAAKAEREQAARERDALRQQLEAASKPAAPVTANPATPPEPTRPEPTEEDIGTKYPTYAAFARDLAKWVVEQERVASGAQDPETLRQSVREMLAQERAEQRFYDALEASQDRARKAYPDFDALLNGATGQIPLGRSKEESWARIAFITQHPQSEHIQYAILKDAALAERLQQSDPIAFGAAIAGLVPAAKAAVPAWTPPPAPPPVVGASTPTTATTSRDVVKSGGSFDAYREKRDRELNRVRK